MELNPAETWIFAKLPKENFIFDEMHLLGNSHLAFQSSDLTNSIHARVNKLIGDKTGK